MWSVTCHVSECGNSGIPLNLELTWHDGETAHTIEYVVCGACDEQITDLREVPT